MCQIISTPRWGNARLLSFETPFQRDSCEGHRKQRWCLFCRFQNSLKHLMPDWPRRLRSKLKKKKKLNYKENEKSLFSVRDQALRVILLKGSVQNQRFLLPPAASLSVSFKGFCFCGFSNQFRLHLWMIMNWCFQRNLNFLDKRCAPCLSC